MEGKQRNNLWTGLLMVFLLPALAVWVFRGHGQEIWDNLRAVSAGRLLLLFGLGAAYQLLESAVCQCLVRPQLDSFSFRQAVQVVFLGVFANVATFGVGVIPMQSYCLYRRGMMAGRGASVMMLEYAFHKSTILIYASAMLLLQGRWLAEQESGLARYLLLGYGICTLIIAGLLLLCAWKRLQQLVCLVIDRLPVSWEARKTAWKENLDALFAQSQRLLHDRKTLRRVLAWNLLKLFCLYLTLFLSVRAVGVSGLSLWRMQLLGGAMQTIVSALPNVAGMGPAEFSFLLIFSSYMDPGQLSSALILFRTATFFFPFLLSLLVFLTAQRSLSERRG